MAKFTDIVLPDGNEDDFIEVAKKLDVSGLIFCYEYGSEALQNALSKNLKCAVVSRATHVSKAKHKNIPILCPDNERFLFEQSYSPPLVVFSLENIAHKDSLHSRHSGLNHILCELASKNNITLGVFLDQLIASGSQMPYLIGRLMQNIRLARKYGMKVKLATFAKNSFEMRSHADMQSLGIILGMSQNEAKESLADNLS